MKLLGVVFALVLLFLPLSMHLEATNDAIEEASTTVSTETEAKGVIASFFRRIRTRMEKVDSSSEIKTEYSEARSKFEGFQKKVEGLLKKLNNTESD